MKYCFKCSRTLPLWAFSRTEVPHVLKVKLSQGRQFACRLCSWLKRPTWEEHHRVLDRMLDAEKEIRILRKKLNRDAIIQQIPPASGETIKFNRVEKLDEDRS